MRLLGTVAAALALAAVLSSVAWFSANGLSPFRLLAVAWPAAAGLAALIGAVTGLGWLSARLMAAAGRHTSDRSR